MRLLKKLDIKNNKVMMGLLSLLFIGSLVQTSAILNVQQKIKNSDQSAQVFPGPRPADSYAQRTCLEVEHKYNYNKIISTDYGHYLEFDSYFNIKNICSYNVSILNLKGNSTRNYLADFDVSGFQKLNSLGEFEYHNQFSTVDGILASTYNSNNSTGLEFVACLDCVNLGSASFSGFSGQYFTIPSGQTKSATFTAAIRLPNGTPYSISHGFRVLLEKIKYARSSNLSDGIISENEIIIHNFSEEEKNAFAHDMTRYELAPHNLEDGIIPKPEETKEEPKAKY